jgi:hypothetical protein
VRNQFILLSSIALFTSAMGFATGITTASGTFNSDDDVAQVAFNISGNTLVTIQSTSFALGGFEPVLTLFDPLGNLYLNDSNGGTAPGNCGARGIDPVSGYCLDGFIQAVLGPGAWTLIITEWDNIPSGPTLFDLFPHAGEGNFTGPNFTGQPGSFLLFDGTQRSADWAVTIDGVDAPEPSTSVLMVSGILGLAFLRRKIVHNN